MKDDDMTGLLAGAVASGVLSAQSSSLITGNLGKVVIAGAAGKALEDIVASDVTLITVLIDASSSIQDRGLEQAVREGQNHLIDAFGGSKQKRTAGNCARLSRDLLASEQFVLAFVGVGKDVDLHAVAKTMGVPDGCVLVQRDATASSLRKAFQLVSQSAIRASQGRIQPGAAAGFFIP